MTTEVLFEPSKHHAHSLSERTLNRLVETLQLERSVTRQSDLITLVREGVSTTAFDNFAELGYNKAELSWIIPQRTLRDRRKGRQPLSSPESDRLIRAVKIHALAAEVFGGDDKAISWLHKPRRIFNGESASDLLSTETGADLVEEVLNKIDAGFAA